MQIISLYFSRHAYLWEGESIFLFNFRFETRDLSFDEYETLNKPRQCQLEETYEEAITPRATEPIKEVTPSHDDDILEEHDMLEPQEPTHEYLP